MTTVFYVKRGVDYKKFSLINSMNVKNSCLGENIISIYDYICLIYTILVVSLIVIDVHARDVVERLINKQISSLNDFEWVSTMRYYLTKSVEDPNEPTVNIEMISTTIEYGFEYLGNTSRLVVTPLTERCYRTLMGALKMNLGGAPEVSKFRHLL